MRVVIVGGVAGGMSTATRLRRLDADAEHHGVRTVRSRLVRQLRIALLRRRTDRRGGRPHAPDSRAAVRSLPARRQGRHRSRRDRSRRAHRDGPFDDHRCGDGCRLRQARAQHGRGAGAAADPRLRPCSHAADGRRRRPAPVRRRRRAVNRGRHRRRVHRTRDGREPRRAGHRRHDRRGDAAGAPAARSGARRSRRGRARRRTACTSRPERRWRRWTTPP